MINLAGYEAMLNPGYWLNPRPVPLGPSLVGGFVFFLAWFLLAALALFVAAHVVRRGGDKLKAKVLAKFADALLASGLLGYLLLFFVYEQVPILSMRLWAIFWLGLFCWWIALAVGFAVKEYPARKLQIEKLREMGKYMPGQRK